VTRLAGHMRYKEGVCAEFGRVRPVHLSDLLSIERRLEIHGKTATAAMRLAWAGKSPAPAVGEYLSLHHRTGKTLVFVVRSSVSCRCCPGAVVFLHIGEVEGVLRHPEVCACSSGSEWAESAAWGQAAGDGLCRKVCAGSLAAISEAIKAKEKGRKGGR